MVTTVEIEIDVPGVSGRSQRGSEADILDAYNKAKAVVEKAEEALKSAKKAVEKMMGKREFAEVSGFSITYKANKALNADRLKTEQPEIFNACVKEPALDPGKFRTMFPALVETYEWTPPNATRILKVTF